MISLALTYDYAEFLPSGAKRHSFLLRSFLVSPHSLEFQLKYTAALRAHGELSRP
jgi:hypothetical protein